MIARTGSEAQSDVHENATACGNTTGGSNASSGLRDTAFILPARRQKLFDEQITKWFICTMTPAQRIEHPAFQAACLQLGTAPSLRKDVYDLWLPKLYASEGTSACQHQAHEDVRNCNGWVEEARCRQWHLGVATSVCFQ
jgi:hypothetical protein